MKRRLSVGLGAFALGLALLGHGNALEAATGDFLYSFGATYQFQGPSSVATGPDGRVFVADGGNIHVFAGGETGDVLLQTIEGRASKVEVTAQGDIYTINPDEDGWIHRYDPSGQFMYHFGPGGYYGRDPGTFGWATDLGVSPATGNVFITDGWTHTVTAFTASGTLLGRWGGYGWGQGRFTIPRGVSVNAAGEVFVTDSYAVQVFNEAGVFLRTAFNSPYTLDIDAAGNVHVVMPAAGTQPATLQVRVYAPDGTYLRAYGTNAGLNGANDLAIDGSGRAYVIPSNANVWRCVKVFSPEGDFQSTWAAYGSTEGKFHTPGGVFADDRGEIYVADTDNHRVQVLDSAGHFLRAWGSYGTGDGFFSYPDDVAVDAAGNVFVSEAKRIQVFDRQGNFLRAWGTPGIEAGQLSNVTGIDVDAQGRLYVADSGNFRVHVFDSSGQYLFGKWFNDRPQALDVGADGRVRISYRGYALDVCDADLRVIGTWHAGFIIRAIDTDACGHAYVTGDGYIVRVFDTGVLNASWGTSSFGEGRLMQPWGLAADASGRVFVSEMGTHRVSVFQGEGCGWATAEAGPEQAVEQTSPAGASVQLDGSASSGSCGTEMTFLWSWPGGSASGAAPLVDLPPGQTTVTLAVGCGTATGTDILTVTVRDTTPPVTTALLEGTAGLDGWFVSPVGVTLTAVDAGSGVALLRFQADAAPEEAGPGPQATFETGAEGEHVVVYSAADRAGIAEAPRSLQFKIDRTSPTITITGVSDGAVYLLGSIPQAGATVTDTVSGVGRQEASLSGGTSAGLGAFTYRVEAADRAGNAASASATYFVRYGFGGFLGSLAEHKPFKLGSTVPVKFRLADAGGNYVTAAVATITLQLYSGDLPVGDPIVPESTSGADTGNRFRYDSVDNQYIYNLSTGTLTAGTWMLTVSLDDGSAQSMLIGFK